MPDILSVFSKWWKFILGLSLLTALTAFLVSLISPKKYLSTATALPLNSITSDKARIFNSNIQELYSDFGLPEELDRVEGTGKLDTIYIATANEFKLADHYNIKPSGESNYKAVVKLKKNSRIAKTAYGELQIKVWDEDRNLAAALANSLLKNIQDIHQHIQNESNKTVLQKINEDYVAKQMQYRKSFDSMQFSSKADADISGANKTALLDQLQQYQKLITQYEIAIKTNPPVLMVVENARPTLWPDKPETVQIILISFFIALFSSFLFALFVESRNQIA